MWADTNSEVEAVAKMRRRNDARGHMWADNRPMKILFAIGLIFCLIFSQSVAFSRGVSGELNKIASIEEKNRLLNRFGHFIDQSATVYLLKEGIIEFWRIEHENHCRGKACLTYIRVPGNNLRNQETSLFIYTGSVFVISDSGDERGFAIEFMDSGDLVGVIIGNDYVIVEAIKEEK